MFPTSYSALWLRRMLAVVSAERCRYKCVANALKIRSLLSSSYRFQREPIVDVVLKIDTGEVGWRTMTRQKQ